MHMDVSTERVLSMAGMQSVHVKKKCGGICIESRRRMLATGANILDEHMYRMQIESSSFRRAQEGWQQQKRNTVRWEAMYLDNTRRGSEGLLLSLVRSDPR